MTAARPLLPSDFVWGAATAAYQIEGAIHEDGRGESIWDRFCTIPGKVRNGESGAIADDHYHRYRDDVGLMRDLGLRGYRFSVAWPRIIPDGRGQVNPKGLDFYDRLIDELLRNDIEPYVTLYHWDLPQVLEDHGGWTNRDVVDAFVDYVEAVVRRLGDRVRYWITQNEPMVTAWAGYGQGIMAPGRTGTANALAAAHYLLLSHGRAVAVIRGESPRAQVGIAPNVIPKYPASDIPADVAAAHFADARDNRWFIDPIFHATYPAEAAERFGAYMPGIRAGDMQTIAAPIDFLAINYYMRHIVRADPANKNPAGVMVRPEGAEFTDMGWEVYPQGMTEMLVRIHRDYAPKRIFISENGAAFPDVRTHDGEVRDPERQRYLERHVEACAKAIGAGVPLSGYFVWSLLDNFEWAAGYSKRFGIVYVDYPTLERVPKGSYRWYRDFIAAQRGAAVAV